MNKIKDELLKNKFLALPLERQHKSTDNRPKKITTQPPTPSACSRVPSTPRVVPEPEIANSVKSSYNHLTPLAQLRKNSAQLRLSSAWLRLY